MTAIARMLLGLAGLIGATGVAAAAAASHLAESRNLAALAAIFLAHGPALLALGLFGRSRPLLAAGLVLAAGTLLFGADLALREWLGQGVFPGAAPIGGAIMILGWIGLAINAILSGE